MDYSLNIFKMSILWCDNLGGYATIYNNLAMTTATIDNCKPVNPATICHKIEHDNDQTSVLVAKTPQQSKTTSPTRPYIPHPR